MRAAAFTLVALSAKGAESDVRLTPEAQQLVSESLSSSDHTTGSLVRKSPRTILPFPKSLSLLQEAASTPVFAAEKGNDSSATEDEAAAVSQTGDEVVGEKKRNAFLQRRKDAPASPTVVVVGMREEHETAARAVHRLRQVQDKYEIYLTRLEKEKSLIRAREAALTRARTEAGKLQADVDLSRKTIAGLEVQGRELVQKRREWKGRLQGDLKKLNRLASGHTRLVNALSRSKAALLRSAGYSPAALSPASVAPQSPTASESRVSLAAKTMTETEDAGESSKASSNKETEAAEEPQASPSTVISSEKKPEDSLQEFEAGQGAQ